MAGFMVLADNWVVSPILPAIARDLGVPAVSAGVLISAYMLPFAAFQIVFGPLADRLGKSRVILFTFIAFTVATGLCALGNSLTGLAIYRALTGAFAAATMPVSLALIADVVPMADRQKALGSFLGLSSLGQALSQGIGGAIANFFNWRGVFAAYAVLSAVVAVFLWRSVRQAAEGHEVLNPGAPIIKPYLALLRGLSLRTYLTILFEGFFIVGSFSYLGTVLATRFGLAPLAIGGITTLFGVAAVVGGRRSSALATRVGRVRTVAIGLAVGGVGNLLVFPERSPLVLVALGLTMLGFSFMTAHSTLVTTVTEFAAGSRGTATSLAPFALMLGGALGTQAGARIVQASSFSTLYVVYGVGLLVTALAALRALKGADDLGGPPIEPEARFDIV